MRERERKATSSVHVKWREKCPHFNSSAHDWLLMSDYRTCIHAYEINVLTPPPKKYARTHYRYILHFAIWILIWWNMKRWHFCWFVSHIHLIWYLMQQLQRQRRQRQRQQYAFYGDWTCGNGVNYGLQSIYMHTYPHIFSQVRKGNWVSIFPFGYCHNTHAHPFTHTHTRSSVLPFTNTWSMVQSNFFVTRIFLSFFALRFSGAARSFDFILVYFVFVYCSSSLSPI